MDTYEPEAARAGGAVPPSPRELLDAAGVAAVLVAPDGAVRAVSGAAETLLGPAAQAAHEAALLDLLAEAAHEDRSAAELAREALDGPVRLELFDDGELLLDRRELRDGARLWSFRRRERGGARRAELLSIAAHDLRSPHANVRSYAGMVLASRGAPLEPRVKRAAEVIAKNAERGLRLVEEVADLLRAEEGKLPLERTPTPIGEPLRLAFEEARQAATDKGATLVWAAPEGLPLLLLDPDRMRRLFRALLEAGVRRVAPGGEVRLLAEERERELVVSVEDDGPRPSTREAALAYDRDHQILLARKLLGGVSLALAARVARAHGGRVGCVPRPEKGAVHFVVLPLAERQ